MKKYAAIRNTGRERPPVRRRTMVRSPYTGITVTSYFRDGFLAGFTGVLNGRSIKYWVDLGGDDIPDFFYELFTCLNIVCPHGLAWGRDELPTRPVRVRFEVPLSDAGMRFIMDCSRLCGMVLELDAKESIGLSEHYIGGEGWHIAFSGGKDSGLTYCMLDELGESISMSNNVDEPALYIPDVPVNRMRLRMWNQSYLAAVIVHALWNRRNVVALGFNYSSQPRLPNMYIFESNDFLRCLNRYLCEVCDISTTSIISSLTGSSVQRLLHERYPDYVQTFTPSCGKLRQRLLHLYCGIPLPDAFDGDTDLSGYHEPDGPGYAVIRCETEHMMVHLRGHPCVGDNPLQHGVEHTWVDRYSSNEALPVVSPSGLDCIISDHFEPDFDYRLESFG